MIFKLPKCITCTIILKLDPVNTQKVITVYHQSLCYASCGISIVAGPLTHMHPRLYYPLFLRRYLRRLGQPVVLVEMLVWHLE